MSTTTSSVTTMTTTYTIPRELLIVLFFILIAYFFHILFLKKKKWSNWHLSDDSYVYISNNLKGETISFDIQLDANNDPTEWPREYRGCYKNLLFAKVNGTGYIKVRAVLGQEVPWGNDSTSLRSSQ